MPSPFRPSPGPKTPPQFHDLAEAFDIVCRNYRLGPDDLLQVLFQTQWTLPPGSYKLDTLDEIDIEFFLDPELNRKVVIRPDGMITLPGIGDVRAQGKTPEELGSAIGQRLVESDIIKGGDIDPRLRKYKLVTVSVISFYGKIKKLVESLTTLTGGGLFKVTVKPDGTLDLPLLSDRILAAGYTVPEVEATVNRLYRGGELKNVIASLSLDTARSRKVYVMGEVRNAGAYEIRQPITAFQALALAGGHNTSTADLTSVILISKDVSGKPIGRRLDLKRIVDVGDMSSAILVKPYDVIFVPRTYISDLNLFMSQYFNTASQVAGFMNSVLAIQQTSPVGSTSVTTSP